MGEGTTGLRKATREALRQGGLDLLGAPKRFLGMVLDLADEESAEMRVFEHTCDEQLLAPYAEAAHVRTPESLDTAVARAATLLVDERVIQKDVAERVALELALGLADFLDIAPTDRMRQDVGKKPEQPVVVVPQRPQPQVPVTPVAVAPAPAPAVSAAPAVAARPAAAPTYAPAQSSQTSRAQTTASSAYAPQPRVEPLTAQTDPLRILYRAKELGYGMRWYRWLSTGGAVIAAIAHVVLWFIMPRFLFQGGTWGASIIQSAPLSDHATLSNLMLLSDVAGLVLLANSVAWLVARSRLAAFKQVAPRFLDIVMVVDVVALLVITLVQYAVFDNGIVSLRVFIPLDSFGMPGYELYVLYVQLLFGLLTYRIVKLIATSTYMKRREVFFVR